MFNAHALPSPGDPQRVTVGLEHWFEAAGRASDPELADFAREFAHNVPGRGLLEAILGNSPFLTQALIRELPYFRRVIDIGADAALAEEMERLERDHGNETDTNRLMQALRIAKRRTALVTGIADIAGLWPLEKVTAALSELAEIALRLVCAHLLRREHAAGRLALPDPAAPERGSGLIVLAMGKLGARELNYSSDIDLMVLYDDGMAPAPPDEMARTFIRLTREMVRLLEERTVDGYVFRTDLRLRPDPGATPLAVSVSAAESYYGSLGQNWERAAMIKARPVVGDPEAAAGFMDIIRRFVWRRSLDFAAIQDIHSIKRQIGSHKGHRLKAVNGHNVKIGRGGIREIEFFAQTQQLIFGGREPRLRVSPTVQALDALVETGRVERAVADELAGAYRFLRRVEHRLQMVDDQQTHELPRTDDGIARIATFLGYDDPNRFRQDFLSTLERVEDHYAHLFEEAPPLSGSGSLVFTGTEDDPETIATLRQLGFQNPSAVAAQVRGWHHGRYRATRSTRAREILTELIPTLLTALGRTSNPDQAFLKFDQFLARLPAGVQLLSLFHANPKLLDLVALILGTAPRLADILARRPAELDAVLATDFFGPLPGYAALKSGCDALLGDARDFEDVLTLTRRWTNEQRFRAGVHILRNLTDADRCGLFLTNVAEVGLATLQSAVEVEFAKRHGRFEGAGFAIVGMGRLGAASLSLRSDLDLITIYEVPEGSTQSNGDKPLSPSDYYTKLTQRLVGAITAQTAEGQLYDVDMRLRPSGNSGPLAVSFEGFRRYQRENAWTWEHMALTRARVLTGPRDLRDRLKGTIRDVLSALRDPDRLLLDVADMRARIDRQHHTSDIWDVKYVRGGMIDIQFIAQYLTLRHAPDRPDLVEANTTRALERLAEAGCLDDGVADSLIGTMRLWRRIQGFLRLTTEGPFRGAEAAAPLKAALIRAAFPADGETVDFAEAEERLRRAAAEVLGHFQRIIEEPAALLRARQET